MATNIEDIRIRASVQGGQSIDNLNNSLRNVEVSTNNIDRQFRSFNTRILAANIQDIAVQAELGVSWLRILGQQGSEVLAAFGPLGAAAGAALAVGIALARPAAAALGIDLRNLKETTQDLTDSVKKYQDAQRANLPTLAGLGNTYGALTSEAKAFFDIQQQLTEKKAFSDLSAAIGTLKGDYQKFTKEAEAAARSADLMNASRGSSEGALAIGQWFSAKFGLGLTVEQAKEVANRLKDIDAAKPEEAARSLNDILDYLKNSGVEASKFKQFFDNSVDPILKINNQILEFKKNLKEAAQQSSDFNVQLMNIGMQYTPGIAAARRANDQFTAARLEGAQKIAEFEAQLTQKTNQDQVDRSAELGQFKIKTEQEVAEKIRDASKAQYDAYRASLLTNETKIKQLDLEKAIINLKDRGLFDAEYNLKYDEDILRINREYEATLKNIGEQRRKNQITATQARDLEQQAADIRDRSAGNAGLQRDATVRAKMIKDEMDLAKKSIEDQIAGQLKLGETIRTVNDQFRNVQFEESLKGLSPFEKEVARIRENARKAALEAGRAFAAGFENGDPLGLSPERAQQLADGLAMIAKAYQNISNEQIKALGSTDQFIKGLTDSWTEYKENAKDTLGQVKTVFQTFTSGFEDAWVNFVKTGKLSFKDLANSVIGDLARIQAKKLVVGILESGGNLLTGLFGRAGGGGVNALQPYMVGENGPEMFVPNAAGRIVPNYALGGGSATAITYNINAVDAMSFKQMVASDPSFIYAVTEQGRRSIPQTRR